MLFQVNWLLIEVQPLQVGKVGQSPQLPLQYLTSQLVAPLSVQTIAELASSPNSGGISPDQLVKGEIQ